MRTPSTLLIASLMICGCEPEDATPPVVTWEIPSVDGAAFSEGDAIPFSVTIADDNPESWVVELRQADGITPISRTEGTGPTADGTFTAVAGAALMAAVAEDAAGNRGAAFRTLSVEAAPEPEWHWVAVDRAGRVRTAQSEGTPGPPLNAVCAWGEAGALGRGDVTAVTGTTDWAPGAAAGGVFAPGVLALQPLANGGIRVVHPGGWAEVSPTGVTTWESPAGGDGWLPLTAVGTDNFVALVEAFPAGSDTRIRMVNRTSGAETAAVTLPFEVWLLMPETADSFRFLSPSTGWTRIAAASGAMVEIPIAEVAAAPGDWVAAEWLAGSALVAGITAAGQTEILSPGTGIIDSFDGAVGGWVADPAGGSWLGIEREAPWSSAGFALGETLEPSTGRLIRWSGPGTSSVESLNLGEECTGVGFWSQP